jgi:hypothetical protein
MHFAAAPPPPSAPTQTTTPPAPMPNNFAPPGQLTGPGGQPPVALPGDLNPSYNSFQAGAERNWLERLASKIPGYKGYMEKETRRDVDKIHREHLAASLFQLKAPINNIVKELSENRRLFETGPIEHVLQKLDKIENRIRYASYGYTGFFDVVKIKEAQLDQLYHFDVALVDDVDLIKAKVQHLAEQFSDAKALKAAAQELEKAVDDLDNKFSQRYQAIENPGWSPY